MSLSARFAAKQIAGERQPRKFELPLSKQGQALKPSEYFGVNVFNIEQASSIPSEIKEDIKNIVKSGKHLPKTHAEIVAQAVSN